MSFTFKCCGLHVAQSNICKDVPVSDLPHAMDPWPVLLTVFFQLFCEYISDSLVYVIEMRLFNIRTIAAWSTKTKSNTKWVMAAILTVAPHVGLVVFTGWAAKCWLPGGRWEVYCWPTGTTPASTAADGSSNQ